MDCYSCTSVYLTKPKHRQRGSTGISAGLGHWYFCDSQCPFSPETKQIQTRKVQQDNFTRPSKKRQQVGNKTSCPDLLSTTTSSSLGRASPIMVRTRKQCHCYYHISSQPELWMSFFFYFAPLYICKTARIQCGKCCHPANYTLSHTQILVYRGQKCPNKAAR